MATCGGRAGEVRAYEGGMKLSLGIAGGMGLAIATAACLVMPPPRAGDPNATAGAPSDPTGAGPSSPSTPNVAGNGGAPSVAGNGGAPKPMIPTSLEVHSDCPKTVGVFLGEKPGFSSGTKSSVSSNSTTTYPRKPDGSLTFWVLDDKDQAVSSTAVTASTKRVTIDKSCKSMTSS